MVLPGAAARLDMDSDGRFLRRLRWTGNGGRNCFDFDVAINHLARGQMYIGLSMRFVALFFERELVIGGRQVNESENAIGVGDLSERFPGRIHVTQDDRSTGRGFARGIADNSFDRAGLRRLLLRDTLLLVLLLLRWMTSIRRVQTGMRVTG